MKYPEFTEDFLIAILGGGRVDLQALHAVVALAEKFDIDTGDIVNYVKDSSNNYSFNNVMYTAMRLILNAIADRVEDPEIADKIREADIYTNYYDSHFSIESLDYLLNNVRRVVRMKTDTIIKNVVKDLTK